MIPTLDSSEIITSLALFLPSPFPMSHRSSDLHLVKSSAGLIGDNYIPCTLSSILLSYHPMAVHKPVARPGIYFIMFTCYKWLHLIGKTNAYDVVYYFLSLLNQKGHQVVGYTMMPNHVHLLLFF